jgi:hypothetical protein
LENPHYNYVLTAGWDYYDVEKVVVLRSRGEINKTFFEGEICSQEGGGNLNHFILFVMQSERVSESGGKTFSLHSRLTLEEFPLMCHLSLSLSFIQQRLFFVYLICIASYQPVPCLNSVLHSPHIFSLLERFFSLCLFWKFSTKFTNHTKCNSLKIFPRKTPSRILLLAPFALWK